MGFGFVSDERFCDGLYFAMSLRMLRKIMKNPATLQQSIKQPCSLLQLMVRKQGVSLYNLYSWQDTKITAEAVPGVIFTYSVFLLTSFPKGNIIKQTFDK